MQQAIFLDNKFYKISNKDFYTSIQKGKYKLKKKA